MGFCSFLFPQWNDFPAKFLLETWGLYSRLGLPSQSWATKSFGHHHCSGPTASWCYAMMLRFSVCLFCAPTSFLLLMELACLCVETEGYKAQLVFGQHGADVQHGPRWLHTHGTLNQHKITNTGHSGNRRTNCGIICSITIPDRITLFFFFKFRIHVVWPVCRSECVSLCPLICGLCVSVCEDTCLPSSLPLMWIQDISPICGLSILSHLLASHNPTPFLYSDLQPPVCFS